MTDRLYYADPYQTRFTARVVERIEEARSHIETGGHPAVVLDRSAFYPTSGGQPHDAGTLNGVQVLDVLVLEDEGDEPVLHVLAEPLAVDEVNGEVDWERRFDHMQQHSGQHVLSAAFVHVLGAKTVGFHLSDDYSTIDVDQAPLSAEALAAVEDLANRVIFENRPVVARFVSDEEVATLPWRKPVTHAGPVRAVHIQGFDWSACGGTHVRATGEIGLLKITRTERRGTETRIEFLAGGRALADYRAKNDTVLQLAQEFTVGHWELVDAVQRLGDDLKEAGHELRRSRDALLDAQATALWHEAPWVASVRVVQAHLAGSTTKDLTHLAQRLVDRPRTVALLATGQAAAEKGAFTFARSSELSIPMGAVLRQALEAIGGRGGGRPEFAQGGVPQADRVAEALEDAFHTVVDLLEGEG